MQRSESCQLLSNPLKNPFVFVQAIFRKERCGLPCKGHSLERWLDLSHVALVWLLGPGALGESLPEPVNVTGTQWYKGT